MTVKVVTDSTADLTPELIEKYNIIVIPLSISVEGKTYLDGVDISKKQFMTLLKNTEELPKSSQPAAGVFVETYNELAKEPDTQIISIHLTEGMSGTYHSARAAAEMSDADVTVVNSEFISHALGFQVLEAAEMAKAGKGIEEIVERLAKVRKQTSLYLMVDTLEYLVKGGRIGKGKALLGSLLKIKPIASLADGVYSPFAKVRTHLQMIQLLTKTFEEETRGKVLKRVGIAHIEAEALAGRLKQSLLQIANDADIYITETSPIISTHTGPGAIALMYYSEEV
ncbi:DegV family protein [Halalkalibacter urbisdiaboli]|uniref:DegV family protein n=1 Tax=Halalkalibacter urbisdiaboli TaxID=1960589 RepID=UPI000B44CA49|nr:DegV family protein [Halalkalibacter urbisdiaboli]